MPRNDADCKNELLRMKNRVAEMDNQLTRLAGLDVQRQRAVNHVRQVLQEAMGLTAKFDDVKRWAQNDQVWNQRRAQIKRMHTLFVQGAQDFENILRGLPPEYDEWGRLDDEIVTFTELIGVARQQAEEIVSLKEQLNGKAGDNPS